MNDLRQKCVLFSTDISTNKSTIIYNKIWNSGWTYDKKSWISIILCDTGRDNCYLVRQARINVTLTQITFKCTSHIQQNIGPEQSPCISGSDFGLYLELQPIYHTRTPRPATEFSFDLKWCVHRMPVKQISVLTNPPDLLLSWRDIPTSWILVAHYRFFFFFLTSSYIVRISRILK